MALDSLRCSLTCATCNLSTVLGSLLGLYIATWPRHLPGWAVISQQTASNKAIRGHLGHARNGYSTVSHQDNMRAGEVSSWKDDTATVPCPTSAQRFHMLFSPQDQQKLPHTSENQSWIVKEMELSRCSYTMDSLFHRDCSHCFGHAVQCNWFYFSYFVIIAAAGSDSTSLQKFNLFSTFTEFYMFWPVFPYQNRHKYHGTIFNINTCAF